MTGGMIFFAIMILFSLWSIESTLSKILKELQKK